MSLKSNNEQERLSRRLGPRGSREFTRAHCGRIQPLTGELTVCNSLKTAEDKLTPCDDIREDAETTMPLDNVTFIKSYAFEVNMQLKSVDILSSITAIDREAFSECRNLKYIVIPSSISSFRVYAFHWCPSLVSAFILGGFRYIPILFQQSRN